MIVLTNHPFLSGRAGRVEALRSVIEAGLALGDLQFKTCKEVARMTRENMDAPRRSLQMPNEP